MVCSVRVVVLVHGSWECMAYRATTDSCICIDILALLVTKSNQKKSWVLLVNLFSVGAWPELMEDKRPSQRKLIFKTRTIAQEYNINVVWSSWISWFAKIKWWTRVYIKPRLSNCQLRVFLLPLPLFLNCMTPSFSSCQRAPSASCQPRRSY